MPPDAWAASGAMALTGRPDGPPLQAPGPVVRRLADLQRTIGDRVELDVASLLAERAAIGGLRRQGTTSCGGATRLLPSLDGWCAVSLARRDDVDLLPAWLGAPVAADEPWDAVARFVGRHPGAEVAEGGQLLGLPVAVLGGAPRRPAVVPTRLGEAASAPVDGALVVDLSSLWAGPLCAHLLQRAGARVVKVESLARPDGARSGPAAFFDLLHAGQRGVALPFDDAEGRRHLAALLAAADVVIEASRPRALAQLGLAPRDVMAVGRVRAWVSITGYGRDDPEGQRVAFGDDGAVAGGLVAWDGDGPLFCADAIADPLTGLTAAAAVVEVLAKGDRWLLDLSLAACAGEAAPLASEPWVPGDDAAAAPRARVPAGSAPGLGQDTESVLREVLGSAA